MKAIVFLLLVCPALLAQTDPNLSTTIDFMDQMVRPEGRQLSLVSNCEVAIVSWHKVEDWLYFASSKRFMVADDTSIKSDQGEAPFPRYTKFNLADVDPTTIASATGGFTSGSVKRFYEDRPGVCKVEDDECERQRLLAFDAKRADATGVGFRTADLKPVVERGVITKVEDSKDPLNRTVYRYAAKMQLDGAGIFFDDRDRAQRFVTAFIHAASLCGGHWSLFAPTPEKK